MLKRANLLRATSGPPQDMGGGTECHGEEAGDADCHRARSREVTSSRTNKPTTPNAV